MMGAASTVVASHCSLSTSRARVAGVVAHEGTPSTAESAIGSRARAALGDGLPRAGSITAIGLEGWRVKSALKVAASHRLGRRQATAWGDMVLQDVG